MQSSSNLRRTTARCISTVSPMLTLHILFSIMRLWLQRHSNKGDLKGGGRNSSRVDGWTSPAALDPASRNKHVLCLHVSVAEFCGLCSSPRLADRSSDSSKSCWGVVVTRMRYLNLLSSRVAFSSRCFTNIESQNILFLIAYRGCLLIALLPASALSWLALPRYPTYPHPPRTSLWSRSAA